MVLHLSKSKYCSAVQCPKMLWLQKNRPEEFDCSVMNEAVLETGNEVGDLAMGLFGDYTEVPYGDLGEMLRVTQELLAAEAPVITEASFAYGGLFCSVDILKNLGGGRVELYEVKSSTEIKDIYLHDTAYQTYVLKRLGFVVEKTCLVHINSAYVRLGELDLTQLFVMEDLTDTATGMLPEVESRVAALEEYMKQTEEPCDGIGAHCFAPYDCGFWGYCTRNLPRPNVFNVAGLQTRSRLKLYNSGLVSFAELEEKGKLKDKPLLQVQHELYPLAPHIDREAIREFLKLLSYPLYFLDFETVQPAIPPYDNVRPYAQIPFQYSLHYIEQEGGELKHTEYLAMPGADPRRALAERLCTDIPLNVCVTAYNMGFEKGRIKELAALFPDLADHLMNIHNNIVDLMVPFQQKRYYCRAMQGSYSIKYVLPALFPDDPALDYHTLEGVHNGAEASNTFRQMEHMAPDELEEYRGYLLKYCGLDTFAMVKVWEKLCEAAAE